METPGTMSQAQPEIQFTGGHGALVPQSSDATVTAAFVRFHRQTVQTLPQKGSRGSVNRTGLALAALAVLGFGGGLSLAFFSFNSPEKSGSVIAARPPEIIYRAPVLAEPEQMTPDAPRYDANSELEMFTASAFELRPNDQQIPETSIWRDAEAERPNFGSFAIGSQNSANAPTFAVAEQQGVSGGSVVGAPEAEISADFGALTAAPVPEPSTWATMISGAGMLMLFTRFKRRRS